MTTEKTWLIINFYHGNAMIEASLNYKTKDYYLTHGSNDRNVTFGNNGDDIQSSIDRAKCVTAALKFIKEELFAE
jgi:hypothetical protein